MLGVPDGVLYLNFPQAMFTEPSSMKTSHRVMPSIRTYVSGWGLSRLGTSKWPDIDLPALRRAFELEDDPNLKVPAYFAFNNQLYDPKSEPRYIYTTNSIQMTFIVLFSLLSLPVSSRPRADPTGSRRVVQRPRDPLRRALRIRPLRGSVTRPPR